MKLYYGGHPANTEAERAVALLRCASFGSLHGADICEVSSVPRGVVRFRLDPFPHYAAEFDTLRRAFGDDERVAWDVGALPDEEER